MIKKYIQFNESSLYKYKKILIKVYSNNDKNKVLNHINKLLNLDNSLSDNRVPYPNLLVIKNDGVGVNYGTAGNLDNYLKSCFEEYPDVYDPDILQMKDLKVLDDILLKGKRVNFINYNEPRQLVYENMKKNKEFELLTEEVKLSKIVKTVNIDGFTIYVGRNAECNDILTTEIAKHNDLLFHVSGVPGSHVVIKVEDKYPSKEVIKKAAKLAAENSKGEGKLKVVYTEVKNVTKNSKHKIGQVQVDYSKSDFIEVNK